MAHTLMLYQPECTQRIQVSRRHARALARIRNHRVHALCRALRVRERTGAQLDTSIALIRRNLYVRTGILTAYQELRDTSTVRQLEFLNSYGLRVDNAMFHAIQRVRIGA